MSVDAVFLFLARSLGMICPAETPEGSSVGLVKNLALMSTVSVGMTPETVKRVVSDRGLQEFQEILASAVARSDKIFVNGEWVGVVSDASQLRILSPRVSPESLLNMHAFQRLVAVLQSVRRSRPGFDQVSITFDVREKEVRIFTDPGRILRPLFIVENGELKIKHTDVNKIRVTNVRFLFLFLSF